MSNNERAAFQAEIAAVEQWFKASPPFDSLMHPSSLASQSPRFARVKRPYTAAQVVAKRGTIPIQYPSDLQGKKLFALLSRHSQNGTPSHTYGA